MAVQMESTSATTNLTSGRLLAGNAGWNLFGTCAPALVAVFCFPVLKRELGASGLGVITLAWAVIGYFGLFDLGLSRALTKLVAEKLGQNKIEAIPTARLDVIDSDDVFWLMRRNVGVRSIALVGGATSESAIGTSK